MDVGLSTIGFFPENPSTRKTKNQFEKVLSFVIHIYLQYVNIKRVLLVSRVVSSLGDLSKSINVSRKDNGILME